MKKAVARETFSMFSQMINKGREFYVRKGSLDRVKLCNTNTNQSCIGELERKNLSLFFDVQEV